MIVQVCAKNTFTFFYQLNATPLDTHKEIDADQTNIVPKNNSNVSDSVIGNKALDLLYQLHDKIDNARDDQERDSIICSLESIVNASTTALEDHIPPERVKARGRPKGSQRLPVPSDTKDQGKDKSSDDQDGEGCISQSEKNEKRQGSESTLAQPPKKIRLVYNLKEAV